MTYSQEERERYGIDLDSGDDHYRAYVGVPHEYSLWGASCFNLLTSLGLREHHFALDIGCGSLRVGGILIAFMLPGHYGAVEPNKALFDESVEQELGRELLVRKQATVAHNASFDFPRLREPYDFAFAHSILSHASLNQIGLCLEKLHDALSDDGIFAATYCPVPWLSRIPEHTGEDWIYPGLTYYRTSTIKRLAREKGFYYYPVEWNTFLRQQIWAIFTKSPRRIPRFPQSFWRPPFRQITHRFGNMLYRARFRLGLAGDEMDYFPGIEEWRPPGHQPNPKA
jgi:SAM-dependent methyltransferase